MNPTDSKLLTPIYIKPQTDTAWPEDPVFYMLTGSGLFLCRNSPFYRSAVPAPRSPSELSKQESFLTVRYPKIPRKTMEYVVGYFDRVAELHGSASLPMIVSLVEQDIDGTRIVTVMLELGRGSRVVGSAVFDGGRAYAVGRAAWSALSSA